MNSKCFLAASRFPKFTKKSRDFSCKNKKVINEKLHFYITRKETVSNDSGHVFLKNDYIYTVGANRRWIWYSYRIFRNISFLEQCVERTTWTFCIIFCSRERGASQFSQEQKIIQNVQVLFSTHCSKEDAIAKIPIRIIFTFCWLRQYTIWLPR